MLLTPMMVDRHLLQTRVTNRTFKIKVASGTGANYQGDYDAIQSVDNQAFMAYTDFRNLNYGAYGAYFPDYAMRVLPATVTAAVDSDSAFVYVSVPSVKAYEKSQKFTVAISPTPVTGNFTFRFDERFPDLLILTVLKIPMDYHCGFLKLITP